MRSINGAIQIFFLSFPLKGIGLEHRSTDSSPPIFQSTDLTIDTFADID